MRKSFIPKEYEYLETVAGQLNPLTTQALNNGGAKTVDDVLWLRYKISGKATVELIDSNTVVLDGVTNIDKGTLPDFNNFVASAMSVKWGVAASGTAVYGVRYTNKVIEQGTYFNASKASTAQNQGDVAAPQLFLNARLEVWQNDKIFEKNIGDCLVNGQANDVLSDSVYDLKTPFLLKEKEQFKWRFVSPDSIPTVSVTNQAGTPATETWDLYMEIAFHGLRTRK
jgi:hypothetical protein